MPLTLKYHPQATWTLKQTCLYYSSILPRLYYQSFFPQTVGRLKYLKYFSTRNCWNNVHIVEAFKQTLLGMWTSSRATPCMLLLCRELQFLSCTPLKFLSLHLFMCTVSCHQQHSILKVSTSHHCKCVPSTRVSPLKFVHYCQEEEVRPNGLISKNIWLIKTE